MSKNKDVKDYVNLSEAEFNDTAKTATVTIIREGFSLNQTAGLPRYYSKQAIKDVAEQLSTAGLMYADHDKKSRSIKDWAACVQEGWVDTSKDMYEAKAKIDFTGNPLTEWLYGAAKKWPEKVGISIDGSGFIKIGEALGRKAAIVESVPRLRSADFVTEPAAGGRVDIAESLQELMEADDFKTTFDDIMKRREPYSKISWAMDALYEVIYSLMSDSGNDVSISEILEKSMEDFYKVMSENLKKYNDKLKESFDMNSKELKEQHPDTYKAILQEGVESVDTKQDEVVKLQEELETLKQSIKALEEEKFDLVEQVDKFKKEQEKVEKANSITKKLEEAKIADKVDVEFKESLVEMSDELVDKTIKAFQEVAKKTSGIKGNTDVQENVVVAKSVERKEFGKEDYYKN